LGLLHQHFGRGSDPDHRLYLNASFSQPRRPLGEVSLGPLLLGLEHQLQTGDGSGRR
jgi:hypothetical protein